MHAKVDILSGVDELEGAMWRKKIRWAASVYARNIPSLRLIAEKILAEIFDTENVIFK